MNNLNAINNSINSKIKHKTNQTKMYTNGLGFGLTGSEEKFGIQTQGENIRVQRLKHNPREIGIDIDR